MARSSWYRRFYRRCYRRWPLRLSFEDLLYWLSRAASVLVALGYVIAALIVTEGRDGRVVIFGAILLLPLALIWFPDVIGSYIGPTSRGGYIDRETPPALVAGAGWFFLVGLPLVAYFLRR